MRLPGLHSIHWKVFVFHLAVLILPLGYISWKVRTSIETSYLHSTEEGMIDTAAVVSELYARLYEQFGADSGKVAAELSRLYSNLNETYEIKARLFGFTKAEVDTRLLVYDPGGRVIFDTKGTATNQDFSQWTDVRHALDGQYGSRWELDKPHQRVNIYSTLPVFVSGKIVGAVSVSKSTNRIRNFISRSLENLLLPGLIALVLATVMAYALSAYITRIIWDLASRAERIAAGESKPLAPPTPSRWKLDAHAFVQFGDGKLNYIAHCAANTDHGSGLAMELEFPAGVSVTKLNGADLADWQATTSESQSRRVHVRWQTRDVLRRELEVEYNFTQPLTAGEWTLKSPRLIDGETNPPLYVLVPEQGLELTAATQTAGPRQLPAWLAKLAEGKNYLVFVGETPLAAKWLPLIDTAQAIIETSTAKMRVVSDGAALTEIEYKIRHERALSWRVDLPEGCELLASSIDGRPVNPIDRGDHVVEFSLPSEKPVSAVSFSYTSKKPAFKPVSGQITVELPQTDFLVHWIDWELRIPVAYEIAAFEGNVESAPCANTTDTTSRVIQLHKELCKKERPRAEFFYQKPQPNK